jgi:hypothetical protein
MYLDTCFFNKWNIFDHFWPIILNTIVKIKTKC